MKDKDIIKALECCTDESYENCNECPYSIDTVSCERMKLLEDSLDLINRQQAEIERLEKTEIEIDDFCRRLCRMRMLNGNAIASYEDLQNYIQEVKSEAVKEFATRLEEYSYESMGNYGIIRMVVSVKDIDNLVKEMLGGAE